MPGRLVDLLTTTVELPDFMVVDSNIVIDWVRASAPHPLNVPLLTPTTAQLRAIRLVDGLQQRGGLGLVTSVSANEVFHFLLKTAYQQAVPRYGADLAARFPNVRRYEWLHLYKTRSDLLKQFVEELERARRWMRTNGLLVIQPNDLAPIASGRTLDEELLGAVERYELDTSDAAILVEARRAGVTSIASADPDLRRAQLDFDVYTWL